MKVMKNNESNENNWTDDWSETISAVKNGQDEQRGQSGLVYVHRRELYCQNG